MSQTNSAAILDVLVIGSGAAGMAAAITAKHHGLSTLMIEKGASYGGSTALSGGVIWVPNNHHMEKTGINDSDEDAWAYVDGLVSNDIPRSKLKTYLEKSKEMLKFFEQNSLVKYEPAPVYPDYYNKQVGAKDGARSLDPAPFTRRELGKKMSDQMLRHVGDEDWTFFMTAAEAHHFFSFTRFSWLIILKVMVRYYLDIPFRLKGEKDNRLTLGKALIGRLRKSVDLQGTELWLNSPLKNIQRQADNTWLALVEREGEPQEIRCRNIVMASGGFEKNQSMREQYLPSPSNAKWSAANPNNTGDGIAIAENQDAKIDHMSYVWWTPSFALPNGAIEALIVNRSMPGCVIVNKNGKRFCNEAEPYEDFVKHQYQCHRDEVESIPAWFIFDARYRREYPIGSFMEPSKFGKGDEKYQSFFDSKFIQKANTLDELSKLIDIDTDGLHITITKMAEYADTGIDAEYGKGELAIDRYYSDHRLPNNPCLAPISEAPFYAIAVWPGDLGTKGGIITNEQSQVLDNQGIPIAGLYACGNVSASVMGDSYPGAGATLGPALTFGYIAGLHMANHK